MTGSAALVVFTRTPESGNTKTRLAPLLGNEGAVDAHVELVTSTLARLASVDAARWLEVTVQTPQTTGWAATYGYDHAVQTAGDLGERMAAVFARLFGSGAEKVCLVGTDCPTLDAAYVSAAFAGLADADLVLGPAADGGYGLIALNNMPTARWRGVFDGVAWGSAEVLSATLARAERLALRCACLPEIWDVDEPADWQRYLRWRNSGSSN